MAMDEIFGPQRQKALPPSSRPFGRGGVSIRKENWRHMSSRGTGYAPGTGPIPMASPEVFDARRAAREKANKIKAGLRKINIEKTKRLSANVDSRGGFGFAANPIGPVSGRPVSVGPDTTLSGLLKITPRIVYDRFRSKIKGKRTEDYLLNSYVSERMNDLLEATSIDYGIKGASGTVPRNRTRDFLRRKVIVKRGTFHGGKVLESDVSLFEELEGMVSDIRTAINESDKPVFSRSQSVAKEKEFNRLYNTLVRTLVRDKESNLPSSLAGGVFVESYAKASDELFNPDNAPGRRIDWGNRQVGTDKVRAAKDRKNAAARLKRRKMASEKVAEAAKKEKRRAARAASRKRAKVVIKPSRTVPPLTPDLIREDVRSSVNRRVSSGRPIITNAYNEAAELLKPFHDMTTEQKRKVFMDPLRHVYETIKEQGVGEYAKNLGKGLTDRIKAVSAISGKVSSLDLGFLKVILANPQEPIDPVKRKVLFEAIRNMTDNDQVIAVAGKYDPRILEETDAAKQLEVAKSILLGKLQDIPVTGRVKDTVNEATLFERLNTPTTGSSKKTVTDATRKKVAQWLDELTGSNEYMTQAQRNSRIQGRRYGVGVSGLSQLADVNRKYEGRRVWDPGRAYSIAEIRGGMGLVDGSGYVKPGMLNVYNLSPEDLIRLEEKGIDSVGMFDLSPGRSLHLKRIQRFVEDKMAEGGKRRSDAGYLFARMTPDEVEAAKNLREMSRETGKIGIFLDIETTFGKTDPRNIMELIETEGYTEFADTVYGKRTLGPMESLRNIYHSDMALALSEGRDKDVLKLYRKLYADDNYDKITQASIHVKKAENGVWKLLKNRSINVGKGNAGFRGSKILSDDELVQLVDRLGTEIGRSVERTEMLPVGGELISNARIYGINQKRFDLERLRYAAWESGTAHLANEHLQSQKLSKLKTAYDRVLQKLDTTYDLDEKAKLERLSTKYQQQIIRRNAMAAKSRHAASVLLGYSGDQDPQGSWTTVETTATRRWFRGKSLDEVADTFHEALTLSTDVQERDFRAFLMVSEQMANEKEIAKRVTSYYSGNGLRRYISTPSSFRGLGVEVFGRSSDVFDSRVRKISEFIDPGDIRDHIKVIAKEDKRGAALIDLMSSSGDKLNETLSGLSASDKKYMNGVLTQVRILWQKAQAEKTIDEIMRGRASATGILFGFGSLWNRFINGEQIDVESIGEKGKWIKAEARRQPLHTAQVDTALLTISEGLADEVLEKEQLTAVRIIQGLPTEADMPELKGLSRFTIQTMGQLKENIWKGAMHIGISTEPGSILYGAEQISERALERVRRFSGKSISGAVQEVISSSFGRALNENTAKLAIDVAKAFPANHWLNDVAKVQRFAKGSLGVIAGLAVGTAAIVAGTNIVKDQEDNEVWRYSESETNSRRELRRRMLNNKLTMGNLPLQSSDRRNYSYNMSNDKHNHLFGRR
jgi:hypothetical protein